jgi:hypothetical protein
MDDQITDDDIYNNNQPLEDAIEWILDFRNHHPRAEMHVYFQVECQHSIHTSNHYKVEYNTEQNVWMLKKMWSNLIYPSIVEQYKTQYKTYAIIGTIMLIKQPLYPTTIKQEYKSRLELIKQEYKTRRQSLIDTTFSDIGSTDLAAGIVLSQAMFQVDHVDHEMKNTSDLIPFIVTFMGGVSNLTSHKLARQLYSRVTRQMDGTLAKFACELGISKGFSVMSDTSTQPSPLCSAKSHCDCLQQSLRKRKFIV